MATSSDSNDGVTAEVPPKQSTLAEEKLNDKTVGDSLDKAAKKSDEAAVGVSDIDNGGEESKQVVWNKANNVAVKAFMGADSWPALSDNGKGLLKSGMESFKSVTEVVVPSKQGTAPALSARKPATTNPQPNSTQSTAHPARQTSFKRHGIGGSTSSNTNSPTQPLPSPPPFSQSQSSSAHSNSSQKKGTGHHQHGDGSDNHRFVARKDQDRPNRNWNNQGNVTYPQPTEGLPRGIIKYLPMPHTSGMYVAPTLRPFGPPISYPEFPFYYVPVPPESRGFNIPYPATGPHQMLMQYIDPELHSKVLNQIDYYFSNENLVKDIYLRNNMDEEGWVSLELTAGFKQVKKLTNNIAFIMEVLQTSTVVEMKDDKVRRRNDWSKWMLPGSLKIPSPSVYRDPGSSPLVARIQKLNVGQENADVPSTSSPSGDPSSQYQGH